MRIAVVQHCLRATPAEDATALAEATARAVAGGAEWVVLPPVPSLADLIAPDVAWVDPPAELGPITVLRGDECVDPDALSSARSSNPSVLVLIPLSENELQAESFLELAIALSDSVAGLVVVVECAGAEPGEPCHGGSAIVLLGKVVAEALGDDDVLFADIVTPVPGPAPREPLPEIPPLLQQRRAFHSGRKLEVPGYPADNS